MTDIYRPRPCPSRRRAAPDWRRRPSVQLVSEGVVATYIHDISKRHRRPAHAEALAALRLRSSDDAELAAAAA